MVWLNLPGTPVLIFAAYFEVGLGFKGANQARLSQMAALLDLLGVPWLILADWNATPEKLLEPCWPAMFGGHLLLPSSSDVTCTMGEGSLIDYGLASAGFMSIVDSFDVVGDVPWAPHLGLSLRSAKTPRSVRIRSLSATMVPAIDPLTYSGKKKTGPPTTESLG